MSSEQPRPGLWVASAPDRPFAAALGLHQVREPADRWPADLFGTFLIASDYLLPAVADTSDPTAAARQLLHQLLRVFPREQMLLTLAALNRISATADGQQKFAAWARQALRSDLAEGLTAAISGQLDGHPRQLLVRPAVLRAMRLIAE